MSAAKFSDIDDFVSLYRRLGRERFLTRWHDPRALPAQTLARGFRCKPPQFVTYIKQGLIARFVSQQLTQCWYLHTTDGLAGYVTLCADTLRFDAPVLRDDVDGTLIQLTSLPAVKLGLLATDSRAAGRGLGSALVLWAVDHITHHITPHLGVRFLTVDAYCDATGWDTAPFYQRMGFEALVPDEAPEAAQARGYRTLYLDLLPLILAPTA